MKHTPSVNPAIVMMLALSSCGPGLEPEPGTAEILGASTPNRSAPTGSPVDPAAPPAVEGPTLIPPPPGDPARPHNCGVLGADAVASMVVLPDGKSFAVGLGSGNVAFFAPPKAGRVRTLAAHTSSVTHLEVTGDGSLATRAFDGSVAVWNVGTGERRYELAGRSIVRIAFSPDGTSLAAASRSDALLVRASDGAVLWSQPHGLGTMPRGWFSGDVVEAVSFSADGTALTVVGFDGTVTYGAADGAETGRMPLRHLISAVSRDGTRMLGLAQPDLGSLALLDGKTGQVLWEKPNNRVLLAAAAFSPDGSTVTYEPYGSPAIVVSSRDGATLLQLGEGMEAVAYSRDGRVLASSDQGGLSLQEMPSGDQIFFDQIDEIGHRQPVHQVAFSRDGNLIGSMSSGGDGVAEEGLAVWRVRDGALLHGWTARPDPDHFSRPRAFAFSPDSTLIARTGEKDRLVHVIDAVTGAPVRSFDLVPGAPASVEEDATSMAFSPDGQTLAITNFSPFDGFAPLVRTYRVADGTPLLGFPHPIERPGYGVSFSPGGDLLAVRVGYPYEIAVLVYRTSDRTLLWASDPWPEVIGRDSVRSTVFSPDGKLVVGMSGAQGIRVFSADSGMLRADLDVSAFPHGSVAFSPDGRVLAVGVSDKLLLFRTSDWSLEREMPGSFLSIAFSPDSSTLAAGTYGGAIHLLCDVLPAKAGAAAR